MRRLARATVVMSTALVAVIMISTPAGAMTTKMKVVRNGIQLTMGPFSHGISCDRSERIGDHGKGKACDFIVAKPGKVATGSKRKHGDSTAGYAKTFRDVKHVIWRQRIWKRSEANKGWQKMRDRGGPTANHYDHVHVSVY